MTPEDAELILTAVFFAENSDREASLREIAACELVTQIEIEGAILQPRLVKIMGKPNITFRIEKEVGKATEAELRSLGGVYTYAKDGDFHYMYELATLLEKGRGVSRDLELATAYYERAALSGHVGAISRIKKLKDDRAYQKMIRESRPS